MPKISYKRLVLSYSIILYIWMIIWAKIESTVKWAYGPYYWFALIGLHFISLTTFVIWASKKIDTKLGITYERVTQLGLVLGGITIIGFVMEDFFAITFAGLFDPVNGINGSVAGISYYDPDFNYYVEAMFPTGFFQIGLFKIPWAYIYLPILGAILIYSGTKIAVPKIPKKWVVTS